MQISNKRNVEISLRLEPGGVVLPMPAGVTFTVAGADQVDLHDDKIVVWANGDNDLSVLLGHHRIYSVKALASGGKAHPDVPDDMTVNEFVHSVLETEGTHAHLVDELASVPARLAEAAQRAASDSEPYGEWSARTILIHMFAGDVDIWQARLKMMAEQDNPHWQWTEPDIPAWEARFKSQTLDELAAEFARTRGAIVAHLRGLDEAGWARVGTHAVYGLLDVAGLGARLLEHDREHLAELERRSKRPADRITDADG